MPEVIAFTHPVDGLCVIHPAPGYAVADCLKDVPEGLAHRVIDSSDLPQDRMFRAAWRDTGRAITEDLTAAQEIANTRRRAARAEEFAPLDILSTVPSEAAAAEAKRQQIRDKDAALQLSIEGAKDVGALRALLTARQGARV